jgi:hypothetical protein
MTGEVRKRPLNATPRGFQRALALRMALNSSWWLLTTWKLGCGLRDYEIN